MLATLHCGSLEKRGLARIFVRCGYLLLWDHYCANYYCYDEEKKRSAKWSASDVVASIPE